MIKFLEDYKKHFDEWYPKEGCGVLGVVKGKLKWFPCENVAEDDSNFTINSKQFIDIGHKADIVAVVHNHISDCAKPSQIDIDNCNATNLKYYIFSYPNMDLEILEPKTIKKTLYGRDYKFGVDDCFEAARDYYKSIGWNSIPPRAMFEDNWWKKDLDYFSEEIIKNWQFKKVEGNMEKNDFIIFTIHSAVGNHCGVYLGNDIFYHHAENRLSCRENLYPRWKKYITGVYRYDA